jgi:putative integral membrane protein (TIGR02587 family)
MLYTMEMWWIGAHTTPGQTLAVLAFTAAPLLVLNLTSGFRQAGSVRLRDAAMDTVEALALGAVLVAVVLVLLREVTGDTPLDTALAKVVYEAFPFCLGIGVANHFLHGARDQSDDEDEGDGGPGSERSMNATVADVGATVIGAVFIALNIAPTDEVPLLASAITPPWTLALMAATLIGSYGIVFVAGFPNQERRHQQTGLFQHPLTETVMCYLVSLASAALMLGLFQRLDGPWHLMLEHTVVLALPASIGGAAGRLAI